MKVFVISSIVVLISIVILSTSSNVESIPIDRVIIKDSAGNQITPVLNKEVFFHYNVQNYGNQSQTYDLDISINDEDTNLPIFHKKMQLILEPDERKPIVWSFTPTTYGNYSAKITKNEITIGSSFSISDYSKSNKTIFPLHGNQKYQIMAPLKQLQYGLALDQVQCKQNLVLVQKYNGNPACVTESTKTKLIERGWTGNKIQNITQDFFSKYEIDYDELVVRNAKASVYKTVQEHPNQNCFTLTDDMLDYFPEGFLEDLESAAEEEFHTEPQIYPAGVYSGYGILADKDFALDFIKKYDFNATKQVFSDNIVSIPDEQYHFDCLFDYSYKQYMLRLTFEQQLHNGNFVNVNVTRNDQGIPTIINDNITVYSGGFNSTVLFHNKLDSDIVLSSDEPIVYHIDEDGDIYENTFAKTLSEFEQVIPPEKFFSYYFATHREKTSQPITYVIEPYDLKGSVTVKQQPSCMTEDQVVSLYNEVKVYPKFPSYLPEGYSFECGIHNTYWAVSLVYLDDEGRKKMLEASEPVSNFAKSTLIDSNALIISYWNGNVANNWEKDPLYDKYEYQKNASGFKGSNLITVAENPSVLYTYYFPDRKSANTLEIYLDNAIRYTITGNFTDNELVKVAESLFTN